MRLLLLPPKGHRSGRGDTQLDPPDLDDPDRPFEKPSKGFFINWGGAPEEVRQGDDTKQSFDVRGRSVRRTAP